MKVKDDAGLRAAAFHMVALIDYTLQTFETRQLDSFSLDECKFCSGVVEDAALYRKNGYTSEWTSTAVKNVKVERYDPTRLNRIAVATIEMGKSRVLDAEGAVVEETKKGDRYTFTIGFRWESGWKVVGLDIEGSE